MKSSHPITTLSNGYQFIDGVKMHDVLGDQFEIPHAALKAHVKSGHLVELRVDSPRFSAHADDELCECENCSEPMTKPILCHEEPESILNVRPQNVPSRGWGEQFWVQVTDRVGDRILARVDNHLYETRLHGLEMGSDICFLESHILAIYPLHNRELLEDMDEEELASFRKWLMEQFDES